LILNEIHEIQTNEIEQQYSPSPHLKVIHIKPTETELDELTRAVVVESFRNHTNQTGRNGARSLGNGVSSIFSRFTKALDLSRVVREIETSVMTSVSCTACKAGQPTILVKNPKKLSLPSYIIALLTKFAN